MKIAVFAGDGIGPEIMREALRVLEVEGLVDFTIERFGQRLSKRGRHVLSDHDGQGEAVRNASQYFT